MTIVPTGMAPAGLPPVIAFQTVTTPSGQTIGVLGDPERLFYEGQAARYMTENKFTNTSDLLDLDRLIFLELLIFRASSVIGRGENYDGTVLNDRAEGDARRAMKENSALISTVKNDLGLTKSQRDRAMYENAGVYISELKARAKEFGVHRQSQLSAALTLCTQLFAIVGAFDRSDEVERGKIGFETEVEILDWIRTIMKPEYEAVDAYFIEHSQKYWTNA